MPERAPENDSPASELPTAQTASDVRRPPRRLLQAVAVVLGLAAVLVLEVLYLRLAPSMSISAYSVVLAVLGLLALALFASELLSWLLFAQSLTSLGHRDRHGKDGPP